MAADPSRQAPAVSPVVLVYTPAPGQAAACAALIGPGTLAADGPQDVVPLLERVEVLFGWGLPGELLGRMPRLRWVQKMGAGVDDVVPWLRPDGPVELTRLGAVFGPAMAEYVLAHVLAFCQDLPGVLRRQARRRWQPYLPVRAAGRTLGVAGTGGVGGAIGRAASALGLVTIGWRRTAGAVAGFGRVFAGRAELGEFLSACDFLVLALPHTPETAGLFGAAELAALQPGALLINVGRGSAVQLGALGAALRGGRLGGAVLDVLPDEPPAPDDPVWSFPRCILTPHVAGANRPDEVVPPFLENLRRHRAGLPLLHRVDLRRGY